ncbi:MAG: universal stress protein [Desulfatiglandaceae bacterium]|jgi:nucleotide-binding universal stress UspA family protein
MAKKILVALDYSENASRAVEFLADTFNPDHEIILFSVIPNTAAVCDLEADTLVPHFSSQQKAFCQLEDEKRVALGVALKKAKEALVRAGFDENKVEVKASTQKRGVARDIVAEAENSNVDILVMGRRGISSLKEFFMGSVSQKVLQLSKDLSILLVQ